jgi:hypothetical protein
MKVQGGPAEARLAPWSTHQGRDESLRVRTYSTGQAKAGASADSAEEMKDTRASALGGFINFFNSYMVSPYFI